MICHKYVRARTLIAIVNGSPYKRKMYVREINALFYNGRLVVDSCWSYNCDRYLKIFLRVFQYGYKIFNEYLNIFRFIVILLSINNYDDNKSNVD